MSIVDHSYRDTTVTPGYSKRLMGVGIAFAIIGAVAIVLPARATLAGELIVAWLLVLWGVLGLWFAWEMRPAREWRYAVVAFGVTLMLGLAFLLFPGVGITTMTIVMMLVFLVEGVVSILLGLRMSGNLRHWGWMLFSGACALIVGLIIMMGWPETAVWTLGLLLGINFLSTGLSLIMLARSARKAV